MENAIAQVPQDLRAGTEIVEAVKATILYPWLISDGSSSATLASKNIRIELKNAFPGVKFSVRTRYASCMSAVDVSWTDGPTGREVDAIIDRYQYEDFDGMTDSSIQRKNGNEFRGAFGSARFVTGYREYSDAAVEYAIEKVAEVNFAGWTKPTLEDYRQGRAYRMGGSYGCDWNSQICDCLELRRMFAVKA